MAALDQALADVKQARLDIAKIRKENADTRTALSDRIKALEEIIANGTIDPASVAALNTELAGMKEELTAFDTDVPDAPAP